MKYENLIECVGDNPYAQQLRLFLAANFPVLLRGTGSDLVDLLTAVILGTKQVRFGPKPSPESTVAIRDVIRRAVTDYKPIPFMIPWGSEKPDGTGVDIAEFMALKQVANLQREISEIYRPGIDAVVRIEDASAPYLFHDKVEAARVSARVYTDGLVDLIKELGMGFIHPAPESWLVSEEQFNAEADKWLPVLVQVLGMYDACPREAEEMLESIGWKGGIAYETRQFYFRQYEKMYPNASKADHINTLARYFASAVARRQLKIRGDKPEWEGQFIDLTFAAPVPGTENYFGRRVHYRTLPLHMSSLHMPSWRSKGYLEIDEENAVRARLASYADLPEGLTRASVLLGSASIELQTDYLCVD